MKNPGKKLSVCLLIALVGFPQISETIYTPALPSVADGLCASASMVERTLAIYFLGFALGVLLWGTLSDWCGRRMAMLTGLVVYGIGTLACANVGSVEALLGWRFLQAFGASVGSVITQTILREAYDGAERTKLFSIMSGSLAFSPAVGPVLGGFISELLGWRANFWVLSILALALSIWAFFQLSETRPAHCRSVSVRKLRLLFIEMMQNRVLLGHILLIGTANGILFSFYQEAPFVFINQLGLKPSFYGILGLLIASATLLAARISFQYSNHFSVQWMIQQGTACILLGSILFILTVMTGNFSLNVVGCVIVVGSLFLIFFGVGLIIPNSLSQALKAYQSEIGSAGSIFGGGYYCLIAGCTGLMSILHNGTALPLPLYMGVLGLVSFCGSQMIRSTQSQPIMTRSKE